MSAVWETLMSAVWGGISGVVSTITSEPLLLIPVGFTFAGGSIGLAKSLMGTRRRRR